MPQIPKHWKHIQCKEMTRVVNSVYIHNNDHLRNIWQLHINNRLYFQWMHLPFLHWWDWWYIRQIDPRPLAVAIWQYSISDPIDVPITLYLCLSNYFFWQSSSKYLCWLYQIPASDKSRCSRIVAQVNCHSSETICDNKLPISLLNFCHLFSINVLPQLVAQGSPPLHVSTVNQFQLLTLLANLSFYK